jgi:DNA-binding transcriptional LysR family regulator
MGVWQFDREGETVQQVRVGGRLGCNDASIAQQWALQGRGILYQSELALVDSLASGKLVRLMPDYRGEDASLFAVLPSRRYVPARVQVVMDQLAAAFDSRLARLYEVP